jgi:hypothetical protein
MLLTQSDRLTDVTATELERLTPGRVVEVGGKGAVSAAVVRAALEIARTVERIGGANRYATANAWRYGFVVRYEKGQTEGTGYNPEPWHLRHVGTALARDYHEGGFHSLESYFGLPAAPSY